MGGSGSGKSTVLRHVIGLGEPVKGAVFYGGVDFTTATADERNAILRRIGVLFQSGALWTSMTLLENVALPLEEYTDLTPGEIRDVASLKLDLVGLPGFEDYYPSEVSGGMQKRAALARAIALDPDVLLFDEPTAGLDPITATEIEEMILALQKKRKTTSIVVTHDLHGAQTVSDRLALIHEGKILIQGTFDQLQQSKEPFVREFLRNGH